MADYVSDSPVAPAAAAPGKNQRTASTAQGKRSNRNRKNNQQPDGTVSDGAVVNAGASPRSKKQHQQRQSIAIGAYPDQQNDNMGRATSQKTRPVSMGGTYMMGTPLKEQAYAGPTFQASPAASSLPVPKFFSKSVPNVGAQRSLQGRLAEESASTEGQQSSPECDVVSPAPVPRDAAQSPLDLFFKADRAEKEKHRSESIAMSPDAARRPAQPAAGPWNPLAQTGKSIFLQELDGGDDDLPSPRTVPLNRRAPPFERAKSSPGAPVQVVANNDDRQTKTQNLKDLLFNAVSASPSTTPKTQSRTYSGSQTPDSAFGSPSPFNRPISSGPSTPQPSAGPQPQGTAYYGNRNLSPLFKAAQSEIPPRPSGLRQEVPNNIMSNADRAVDTHPSPTDGARNGHYAFARNYLEQQVRSSGPAEMPQLSFPTGSSNGSGTGNTPRSGPMPNNGEQYMIPSQGHMVSPQTGGSKDMRVMENELKTILKLNVLG